LVAGEFERIWDSSAAFEVPLAAAARPHGTSHALPRLASACLSARSALVL